MKNEAKFHLNRNAEKLFERFGRWPGGQSVYGKQLDPGDILQETDLFESSKGNWETCPCPGLRLQDGVDVVWIRPESTDLKS